MKFFNNSAFKAWAIIIALSTGNFTLAQTCPSIKRNNGNNAAHTIYATSVLNTDYTTVPSSSKEGTITVNFGSTFPSSSVPVIEGVYVGGTRLSVDFGPPRRKDCHSIGRHERRRFYSCALP